MLEQTFIHIPGIGPQTEQGLWQQGVRSWGDVDGGSFRLSAPLPISSQLKRKLEEYIPKSKEALRNKDASFFERLSSLGEAWRLFPEFASECVYLDIETTGLSSVFDRVTMVGLYDGKDYNVYIADQNLQELPERLQRYSVVVTFNGSGFDLRFLKLAFPDLELPPIHIDLRWVFRKLGYRGGLKVIEQKFRIKRPESVQDIDGYDATVLWAKYLRGEQSALSQLIEYNTEDVVHLKALMELSYDKMSKRITKAVKASPTHIFKGISKLPVAPKSELLTEAASPTMSIVKEMLQKWDGHKLPRIVGIDLTGSEKRATGWALLDGCNAETKCLRTDDELFQATVRCEADIVSIDSPLSLPNGCANPESLGGAPIYRRCELALKRMGISVFWCLLPSMKSLTLRGMRLAERLRNSGMKVIESYPGAAQDLLGIPRKGTSLEELKWGLNRAGITGSFLTCKVVHDEVDAITSALVGLFYLAGNYIALGDVQEDYLIVPRSPQINYRKLAEILRATGLNPLECLNHGESGGTTVQ